MPSLTLTVTVFASEKTTEPTISAVTVTVVAPPFSATESGLAVSVISVGGVSSSVVLTVTVPLTPP